MLCGLHSEAKRSTANIVFILNQSRFHLFAANPGIMGSNSVGHESEGIFSLPYVVHF